MTEKGKKTLITVIVMVACACVIGSAIAGLVGKVKERKDNKDSTNSSTTAAVQVVDYDLNAF